MLRCYRWPWLASVTLSPSSGVLTPTRHMNAKRFVYTYSRVVITSSQVPFEGCSLVVARCFLFFLQRSSTCIHQFQAWTVELTGQIQAVGSREPET